MTYKKREFELLDLDVELLRDLPDEGAKVAFQNIAATVKHLKGLPKYEGVTAGMISGRLRAMKEQGLTVDVAVLPVGDGRGWQRSAAGKTLAASGEGGDGGGG